MNTEWGVILGLTHHCLAYLILSLHSALEAIDPSYLRAASVLGATPAQTFRRVTLPLSLPGVFSGCLLVFAIASSAFMIPLLFSGRAIPVLTVYAYELNATLLNWPLGAAAGIVLLILSGLSIFVFSSYVARLRTRLAMP
ncbi:MAG: hypothetical protein A2W26_11345 [Acidobacteria bacterium RBG_16_64_8]|nr:MAG: hypothetical protein A2W26_11345 [Acidobacteria bacterium RBG_16_64_8]